ncbi:MAG: peptide chain release factor 3, partial [Alphaproteobacteria bacterium]|nr:peptide chain release factor 3 [Alphaproteobacteria bacterium]
LDAVLPADKVAQLREEVEMARELCPAFDMEMFRQGHMTPVFFGSAINSFGVHELQEGLTALAPPPRTQPAESRGVQPCEDKVSAFVFKIQANMDPKHRDRIAFVRLCSGQFKRGMKLKHVRSGKTMAIPAPLMFLAQDREVAEEAFPGDILGIPNHGNLRIGDALTEGEDLRFTGIPSFAPEYLKRAMAGDPLKAKHLGKALFELAEEGVARVFRPLMDPYWIVGVVGALQFDVLADRIRTEYGIPVRFESANLYTARWIGAKTERELKLFQDQNRAAFAEDHDGSPVFLARNSWHLTHTGEQFPNLEFRNTKE